MKRFIPFFIVLCAVAMTFSSCGKSENILAKPEDTSLEFWIADDVSDVDFSSYYEEYGWFGANAYYGKEYKPIQNDGDSKQTRPDYYVIYLVSGYPDASDDWNYITQIFITDPKVSVYGVTCNSSQEEFEKIFTEKGGVISDGMQATFGKSVIHIYNIDENPCLSIRVETTNKYGIIY